MDDGWIGGDVAVVDVVVVAAGSRRGEGGGGGVLGMEVLRERLVVLRVLLFMDSRAELLRDIPYLPCFIWLCRLVSGGVGGRLNCACGFVESVDGVIETSLGVRGNGFRRRSGCINGGEVDVGGIEACTGGVLVLSSTPRINLPCLVLGGGGFLFSCEGEAGSSFSADLIPPCTSPDSTPTA